MNSKYDHVWYIISFVLYKKELRKKTISEKNGKRVPWNMAKLIIIILY